jgi:hypothetical protein
MVAIGGKPGRGLIPQGRGYAAPPDIAVMTAYTHAKQFEARTMAMLSELAARADATDRRMAAYEAREADRKAQTIEAAQAFLGVLRYAFTGR